MRSIEPVDTVRLTKPIKSAKLAKSAGLVKLAEPERSRAATLVKLDSYYF